MKRRHDDFGATVTQIHDPSYCVLGRRPGAGFRSGHHSQRNDVDHYRHVQYDPSIHKHADQAFVIAQYLTHRESELQGSVITAA